MASVAAQLEHVTKEMTKAVLKLQAASFFEPSEIAEMPLKLSQAYCLMWQENDSGDVDGRRSSFQLLGGAVAAALLDLIVMGRIELVVAPKSALGLISYKKNYVKIINHRSTESYLDAAIFSKLATYEQKMLQARMKLELSEVIRDELVRWKGEQSCATVTLNSLVDLGILDRKSKRFGLRYPTLNPEPEQRLVKEIREIALDYAEPNSYMRILLSLLRSVDGMHVLKDPLLKRHFTKEEYKGAKERIKHLASRNKEGSAKYEAL